MTPRDAIRNAAAALEARGVPDSLYDAAQLLSFLTGKNALLLRLDTDTELTEETLAAFHDLCARRAQREPLQYILGSVSFLAHEFHADARALIPRPETELLAERVIALVTNGSLRSVLDLCCGTGCIGISIALACPDCVVTLSDLSHDALSLAQENAAALGASVQFLEGDLFMKTASVFRPRSSGSRTWLWKADATAWIFTGASRRTRLPISTGAVIFWSSAGTEKPSPFLRYLPRPGLTSWAYTKIISHFPALCMRSCRIP